MEKVPKEDCFKKLPRVASAKIWIAFKWTQFYYGLLAMKCHLKMGIDTEYDLHLFHLNNL